MATASPARFELIALAGQGGMASVYRARDRETGQEVALKLLRQPREADRFLQEAQLLAELEDDTIVRYVAHGRTENGELYLAMEWLEGEDLASHLKRSPLAVADTIALGARIARALGVAHAKGIIHRDIKPRNVFLPSGGAEQAKVLDFGIARWSSAAALHTTTGVVLGTPAYMAPEQARGKRQLDGRADLFGLGAVLFHCLAGAPPFTGESAIAVLSKIVFQEAPRVRDSREGVPPALDELIDTLLSKDPAERPADGAAAAAVLELLQRRPDPTDRAMRSPRLGSGEQRFLAVLLTRPAAFKPGRSAPLARIRATVDDFGGSVERLVDGSIIVTFSGGVTAAIDRVCQAARCALALRALLPDAPMVLAMGRADVTTPLAVGEVMDRAARMLGGTLPGDEIRLDELTASMLEGRFAIRRGDVIELDEEQLSTDTARTLLGKRTPFVGRQRELGIIESWFDECVSEPRARAVIVTAPPGIGKSRLAQEFARKVGPGAARIWTAHADPTRAGAPLGLLAPLVRRVLGLRDGEPLEDRQRKLAESLSRRVAPGDLEHTTTFLAEMVSAPWEPDERPQLAAARRDPRVLAEHMRRAFCVWLAAECDVAPVVLILDDLHWGDLPTVKFIEFALRELADRPLFVFALARPEVDERFPRVWASEGSLELRLGGLAKKACELLVSECMPEGRGDAGVTDRIVQQASGNAFFLEELIRAVSAGNADTLPDTVLATATTRLERLPMEARRVMRAASVFGEVFWPAGVASLLGEQEARNVEHWLRELTQAELVAARGDAHFAGQIEYVFRHGLVRDAAYAMLTDADRQIGHRLAGEWLVGAGESQASVIAQHFERGEDAANARTWYVRAAAQALEANDFQAVQDYGSRAKDLGAIGDTLREAYELRGTAHMGVGAWAKAPEELRAALALVADERREDQVRVRLKLARACFFAFQLEEVRRHAEAALVLLDGLDRGDLMAEATAALGVYEEAAGNLKAAAEAYEAASLQARGGYFPSEAQLLMALFWLGDIDSAIERGRAFVSRARAMNDVYATLVALPQVALGLVARGRYAEAESLFREARATGSSYGAGPLVARTVAMSAGYRMDLFDLDGAEAVTREAQEMARSFNYPPTVVSTSIDLLCLAARAGDPGRADRDLPSVAEAVRQTEGKGFHGWLFKLRFTAACGEIELAKSHGERALACADDVIAQSRACGRIKYDIVGQIIRGQALLSLGRREQGIAELRNAHERARRLGDPALVLRAGLELLEAEGDDALLADTRATAGAIRDALPEPIRARFTVDVPGS